MKRILVVAALLLVGGYAWTAFAAGYGAAGCGPGSVFFHKNTKTEQLMSWAANVAFGRLVTSSAQPSAILSGVSNCTSKGLIMADKEDEVFVSQNFSSLTREMATGEGEGLRTLAGLLGCPEDQMEAFSAFTQANYSSILQSSETTPTEMLEALKQGLSNNPLLRSSCRKI